MLSSFENQGQPTTPSLDGIFQDPLGSDPFADFFKRDQTPETNGVHTSARSPNKGGDNGDNEGILE